jgi:bifunctional non-homologous end joining protein LigD
MRIADVPGRRGARFRMCVLDDERSLLWAAQVGTIELHPFLWRLDAPDRPDWLVFDLDPGPPADVAACCDVALELRSRLDGEVWVKTSGSVGLHVLVPAGGATFAETKARAREVAEGIEGTVLSQRRALRAGKVLVDVQQNDPSRSLVAAWSLRATAWPTVSMPVSWNDVERTADDRRAERLVYDWRDVLKVIE